jgi:16S rRNA (guanine1207-N2)-methyltransferase
MFTPALDTLFRPWRQRAPRWAEGDRLLFLNARAHPDFAALGPAQRVAVQPFRPWADALTEAGEQVVVSVDGLQPGFAAALVLLDRHRDVNLGMLAQALRLVRTGGVVLACGASNLGAGRYERMVREVVGEVRTESKHHCRVFEAVVRGDADEVTLAAWEAAAAPRVEQGVTVQAGVFGVRKADPGSVMLALALPADLSGEIADLGAGGGFLTAEVLSRGAVGKVTVVEADARALACARQNLAAAEAAGQVELVWQDATTWRPGRRFDHVVMNPPHHEGERADTSIGVAFVTTAAAVLKPGGRLWLVANRTLPYEAALREQFEEVRAQVDERGYKVLMARRPRKAKA